MNVKDLKIIYEDNHLIVVNKPAGVLAQGDETGDTPLLDYVKQYVKVKYNKPGDVYLGLVHRLDRPVSGAIIFARTSKSLERMNKLFHDREIEKKYWAITTHRPPAEKGHLEHYLLKDTEKNITRVYDAIGRRTADAKKAELDYELLSEIGEHCLLEVLPETGRPHQIRAQLSRIGSPIKGDLKYGGEKGGGLKGGIYLHCRSMTFIHPTLKTEITVTAPLPRDRFWQMFGIED